MQTKSHYDWEEIQFGPDDHVPDHFTALLFSFQHDRQSNPDQKETEVVRGVEAQAERSEQRADEIKEQHDVFQAPEQADSEQTVAEKDWEEDPQRQESQCIYAT